MNNILDSFKKMLTVAAESDIPVLLMGESGSGKEVAARELHAKSPRKNKPIIAVNCGALSANITESLLCGHIRGAFTGANTEQKGFVRAANGGTLFLDEIGELSMENQKIFLRILQEKAVVPVGLQKEIPVDFRLICASNKSLENLVKQGKFRDDLYFRVSVFPIKIPPLRERLNELKDIVESIWQLGPLSEDEFEVLRKYKWPGNIRQLKNVLERYALLKEHNVSLLSLIETEFEYSAAAEPQAKYRPSSNEIINALSEFDGNKSRAAQNLGISRGSLCYQIKKISSAC